MLKTANVLPPDLMKEVVKLLNSPNILIYLGIVIGSQIIYGLWNYLRQKRISQRRKAQGLPDSILINHAENLAYRRLDTLVQSGLLLASIVIVPFILVWISDSNTDQRGLAIAFLLLLAWIIFNSTDVVKAFLGGLSFKTIAAFKKPFQIGDRVTLREIQGKVISFDAFFVVLQTLNDDHISIPTHTLWSEVLSSANDYP